MLIIKLTKIFSLKSCIYCVRKPIWLQSNENSKSFIRGGTNSWTCEGIADDQDVNEYFYFCCITKKHPNGLFRRCFTAFLLKNLLINCLLFGRRQTAIMRSSLFFPGSINALAGSEETLPRSFRRLTYDLGNNWTQRTQLWFGFSKKRICSWACQTKCQKKWWNS